MTAPLLLEDAWDLLNEEYALVASKVMNANPNKKWEAMHYETEAFAFVGYASFVDQGPDADEDIVIDVTIARHRDVYSWSCYIGDGLGNVFTEGPIWEEPRSKSLVHWLGTALDQTIVWLRAETPNIVGYLSGGKTSYVLPPP